MPHSVLLVVVWSLTYIGAACLTGVLLIVSLLVMPPPSDDFGEGDE